MVNAGTRDDEQRLRAQVAFYAKAVGFFERAKERDAAESASKALARVSKQYAALISPQRRDGDAGLFAEAA